MVKQLAIPFLLQNNFKFELFVKPENDWQVSALKQWSVGQISDSFCWLWGGAGSGKTHLLHSACHMAVDLGGVFCLDLADHSQYSSDVLYGLEGFSLVCLDNIENIFGDLSWEKAVFSLYNDLVVTGKAKLLVSAKLPVDSYNIDLLDLQSRMSSGLLLETRALSRDLLKQALIEKSLLIGFNLPLLVSGYLISQFGACSHCLFSYLDVLSERSLQEQRKFSIAFVKENLHLFKSCKSCC